MTGHRAIITEVEDLLSDGETPDAEVRHKVEWKGPQHKFAVIRLADSAQIKDGCKTREEAQLLLREHERVIAGS